MNESTTHPFIIGIIGGGPAGMSCALWLKHLGYRPIIIEQQAQLGGQLRHLQRLNRWVLGMPGKTSAELAEFYATHIRQEAIETLYDARLLTVTARPDGFAARVGQAGNTQHLALRALVIATGAKLLGPEVFAHLPGFQAAAEAGLITFPPLAHLDLLPALTGKTVVVLGGGDNAHFTAKDLALAGATVHLLMRSTPKARPAIRNEVASLIAQGVVLEQTGVQVAGFNFHKDGMAITLDTGGACIIAQHVFVRIGFAANSGFLKAFTAFSGIAEQAGYIQTDAAKRTSIPWVYAVGDVANAKHQSVVNAIAEGALAAQDLSERVWTNDSKSP